MNYDITHASVLIKYPTCSNMNFQSTTIYLLDRNKQECYLTDKTIQYIILFIKLSFSSIGQDKSKVQKQISKLLILIAMAA